MNCQVSIWQRKGSWGAESTRLTFTGFLRQFLGGEPQSFSGGATHQPLIASHCHGRVTVASVAEPETVTSALRVATPRALQGRAVHFSSACSVSTCGGLVRAANSSF